MGLAACYGQWEAALPCLPHTLCHPGEGPVWSCRTYLLPPGTTVQRTSDAADKGRNVTAENFALRSQQGQRQGPLIGLDLGYET